MQTLLVHYVIGFLIGRDPLAVISLKYIYMDRLLCISH